MHRLTGSPKPGKSPRERARAVSLLVAPILLSALPPGLAQLGRSSWDYQGSAKRFRGSQNLRSSPPGLASVPSRVGEGSRVDPCPLCYFTCDLGVAGRDTQLIWLVCDSPVGTGHLATPCEPFGLALPRDPSEAFESGRPWGTYLSSPLPVPVFCLLPGLGPGL